MDKTYIDWIESLKQKIKSAQLKASIAVNEEMIRLYWDIGKSIVEKQESFAWGSKVVEQLAKDLKRDLPDTNGFSRTNLFAMRKFYSFFKESELIHQAGGQVRIGDFSESSSIVQQDVGQIENTGSNLNNPIVQQAVGQLTPNSVLCKIPWGHHIVILNKTQSIKEAQFYIQQTIQNNWSRSVLEMQLASKLIERQGKAQNNFELTLPKPQSDLARETLKDPFKFDFLTLEVNVQELELERKLTENITQFLLELGKGFAFVGRQYPLQVGNKERRLDLLFYHIKMHCYVVIDLKMGEFEPEYAGKMNYYLSAIDKLLKTEQDNPSVGIILCKSKDTLEVEYALQDMNKPMGISEFTFSELPQLIQRNMPSVEELENELNKLT
ncbi:PDDEXK nuclease domain-containing protein [Algoriphagus antarcticus]|uniref:Putative nuclease of restriction endonuclease-like (RecB) superfamily n=1 Tax=Algoriphagus antarcticus TaxID=238540 RepID=A0A3E0DX41_9BACT|nr:PDDEXK nuclease domain-containing protein [Algoriphagus antarcticus]REG87084.1 putative nuclease of restriction endonuclease-like (RecB) superfamily [Algoriphagus antarcticus]